MNIGFDAKRAFHNVTGLGNYSRTLLTILPSYYPQHQYTLFTPRQTELFPVSKNESLNVITPHKGLGKYFPSWWRSSGVVKDILSAKVDIYHGLSNELPSGIKKAGIKSVVTVHDLIYERYPETYSFDERYVHRWKIKYACKTADTVIAISKQTKNDLIQFYNVPEEKIVICYQNCNPVFFKEISNEQKLIVKKRYLLPDKYFLFVSSIAPRKNLITVCKAMVAIKEKTDIPLVVIGNGKKEKDKAKNLMKENGIPERLILLNEMPQSKEADFKTGADFPAIYQQALALVYPSIFEGFGLPILEALCSGLPVISGNTSSLPEVGGDAALYFSPHDDKTLAEHMLRIINDKNLRDEMRNKGLVHARKFTPEKHAEAVMQVYEHVGRNKKTH